MGNGRTNCEWFTAVFCLLPSTFFLVGKRPFTPGLCYTLPMDASEAKAYVQRWKAVAEIEQQGQLLRSVPENWRQLNAIRRRAARLGITREDDEGEMALFLLWARLKADYVAN